MGRFYRDQIITKSIMVGDRVTNIEVIDKDGNVKISEDTPVNAVAAKFEIPAAVIALLANDDIIAVDGVAFTKASSAETGNNWTNAASLATKINALTNWDAVESGGKVTVTAAVKGKAQNGKAITVSMVDATTASGGENAKSTATIAAESLAQVSVGDVIEFADTELVKAAVTDAEKGEFADATGLATCLGAIDGWDAAVSDNDVVITAAENGDNDGEIVTITLYRVTASGEDGTLANKGDVRFDSGYIYVAIADNTISDANWKKAALS